MASILDGASLKYHARIFLGGLVLGSNYFPLFVLGSNFTPCGF